MSIGLKQTQRQYSSLVKDQTPQHFMSPFQRQDVQNRMTGLAEIQRSQAEQGIAQRTRDTSSPAFQQQMAQLAEGTAGVVGQNLADVEQKDLLMGEQKKQQRLSNLQKLIGMKQQAKQYHDAKKAASAEPEESASDKFLGKYTLGGKIAKKAGMSPTQLMMMAAGGAAGGPMGASMGASMGGVMGGGGQAAPSAPGVVQAPTAGYDPYAPSYMTQY